MNKRNDEIGISFIWRNGLFGREGKVEGSRGNELLIDHPSWQKSRKEGKKTEERSNSPCRGNGKFERKSKGKRYKASDCSFDSSFVTGISKISLLISHLWRIKTLLPGAAFLPPFVGGCPAQLPQQTRAQSSGLPSSLWPSGSLGLMVRSDKLEFTYKTSQ